MGQSKSTRLGIDIGGTFTDLIVTDEEGRLESFKAFTTDPEFERGVGNVLKKPVLDAEDVSEARHGTTVATNAVVERTGVTVGLLHTDGFRDLMDMGRGVRPPDDAVNPHYQRPHEVNPIVPRYLRRPVKERILEDGSVLFDLEENIDDLRGEINYLLKQDVDVIVVCLMHGYKYSEHEERVKEEVEAITSDVPCFTSSDICPYPREYDRTCTTVLNGYTSPIMTDYLERYQQALDDFVDLSDTGTWYMTNSRGMTTYEEFKSTPVKSFESGPVAGMMGVQRYSSLLDSENLLGFDMGGTTCDIGMIRDGELLMSSEHEIEHDIISALPTVDINSIGSGGGSIASIDPAGGINVGPESAGSDPGPACFGRGGEEPTLTDAFAVLDYLSSDYPLGGEVAVDEQLARDSMEDICDALGIDPETAADLIYEVASSDMAEAIREQTVYRGIDPSEFSIVGYGAGGPVLASKVAEEVEISEVVIPRFAGVFSAVGLGVADITYESVEPIQELLPHLDTESMEETFAALAEECLDVLRDRGLSDENISLEYNFDGWYQGQSWDLRTKLSPPEESDDILKEMQQEFTERHETLRGFSLDEAPIRCLQARVTGFAQQEKFPINEIEEATGEPAADHRDVTFAGERQEVPCYDGSELKAGHSLEGPAIIHTDTYTVKVDPGQSCEVDAWGNYRIQTAAGSR